MGAQPGSRVRVLYVASLDDGTVVESSQEHGDYLEFTIGKHEIIPGFEKGIIGMEPGEERKFPVAPKEGYGEYREDYTEEVPLEQLPDPNVTPGTQLTITSQTGTQVAARIKEIRDGVAVIDFNHPLAGQRLTFSVRLLEIVSG